MKITIIFIITTFLCVTTSAQIPRGKSCEALGRPDIIVQPYEVLDNRLPNLNMLNLTEACMTNARQQNEQWRQEDLTNWERFSNQLCSAKVGWVENVPGTCQAGGPPPICTANHWHQNPNTAIDSFNNLRKQIAEQRFESLMSGACDCLRTELEEKVTSNVPKQDTSNPFNINNNPFVIPCSGSGGWCPPGTQCKDFACKAPTYVENKSEKVIDFALEKAKDKAIDKWLDMFKELADIRIPASLSSMSKKITSPLFAFLDPKILSTNRDGYNNSMSKVGSDLGRLRQLYQELQNYYQNRPARAPKAISADIQREKKELRNNMADLNIFYIGVVKQKELSKYSCYSVFEFQNQLANQSMVNVLSLPEPEK